jgi:hypothetical protein
MRGFSADREARPTGRWHSDPRGAEAASSGDQTHAARLDLAFVLGVLDENVQYGRQNRALFERFTPKAVFPMHAEAGARMYREFADAFSARLPGLSITVPEKLGDRFEYRGGRTTRSGT